MNTRNRGPPNMNTVKLICKPDVDYTTLREVSRKTLQLDATQRPDEVRSTIAILEKWRGLALAHFSFSFLFCSTHFHLTESCNETDLQHLLIERADGFWLAYVTGTLEQWNRAVVNCTQHGQSPSLRMLYSAVYAVLRDYLPTTTRSEIRLIGPTT
jgi:hypothetical protein